ncbi:hypothetical protein [Holospora curviuscula]|uniref:hypothetical protein n=1 Tax=Holospora curviuscula TaxID=1082868 RepID=UPI00101AD8C2|nr:hypothetical protein [Holospora curviuscula]
MLTFRLICVWYVSQKCIAAIVPPLKNVQKYSEQVPLCGHSREEREALYSCVRALEEELLLVKQRLRKETYPPLKKQLQKNIYTLQCKLKEAKKKLCFMCGKEKILHIELEAPFNVKRRSVSIEIPLPEKDLDEIPLPFSVTKLEILEKIDRLIETSNKKIQELKIKLSAVNSKIRFLECSTSRKNLGKLQEEAKYLKLELEQEHRMLKTYGLSDKP